MRAVHGLDSISRYGTRVGLVEFSTHALSSVDIDLDDYSTLSGVLGGIDGMVYDYGKKAV